MDSQLGRTAGGRDRGQTNMDFAIGIGIFLLAITFTLTFVPSIITPFDTGIGGAENAQADRIAAELVHQYSGEEPNEIDWDEIEDLDDELDERAETLGLRHDSDNEVSFDRVNIELRTTEGDHLQDVGDTYEEGDPAAASSRIVTTVTDQGCDPACRLTVRVW